MMDMDPNLVFFALVVIVAVAAVLAILSDF